MSEPGHAATDRIDTAFDRLERSMQELQQDLADLVSESLRRRYEDRPRLFSDLIEKPTTVSSRDVNDLLMRAVTDGHLTDDEAYRALRTDLVIRGGNLDAPTYLVVEVSRTVSERDVRVAARRASTLRKAGYEARAAVAGQNIRRDAQALAQELGVGRMFECEFDGEDPVSPTTLSNVVSSRHT
jgi:hypothetical protein